MDERIMEAIDASCCYERLYMTRRNILALQETSSDTIGFDFTIFSLQDGREIDGGVYEDDGFDIDAFLDWTAREFLGCKREEIIRLQ